ncbi:MAG: hypothetical protein IJ325_04930 [Clostridia bacterium]|nr:hypothetical protein [Clostridia bacterium]
MTEYSMTLGDDFSHLTEGYADHPGRMNKTSTEYLLEVPHEKYASAFGKCPCRKRNRCIHGRTTSTLRKYSVCIYRNDRRTDTY